MGDRNPKHPKKPSSGKESKMTGAPNRKTYPLTVEGVREAIISLQGKVGSPQSEMTSEIACVRGCLDMPFMRPTNPNAKAPRDYLKNFIDRGCSNASDLATALSLLQHQKAA